jgi:AraC-like DNA-binding protein
VIHSTQLLVHLLARISETKELSDSKSDNALRTLIKEELAKARLEQIVLPIPKTTELQKIATDIRYGLAQKISVHDVAKKVFMSERTFTRKFKSETGFSFELWRNMALLQFATELLADGLSVSVAAEKIGFESVSAFIASFKKEFGITPKQYAKFSVD